MAGRTYSIKEAAQIIKEMFPNLPFDDREEFVWEDFCDEDGLERQIEFFRAQAERPEPSKPSV